MALTSLMCGTRGHDARLLRRSRSVSGSGDAPLPFFVYIFFLQPDGGEKVESEKKHGIGFCGMRMNEGPRFLWFVEDAIGFGNPREWPTTKRGPGTASTEIVKIWSESSDTPHGGKRNSSEFATTHTPNEA
jgi:hypothetical protein